MSAAWLVLQIFIVLFYKNLHEFNDELPVANNSINAVDEETDEDEEKSLLRSSKSESYQSSQTVRIVDNSETGSIFLRIYSEYVRDEVVAVYFTAFTVFFMQTSLETFLTPYTKDYFNWSEEGNSILYSVCGIEIMLVFCLLTVISKKIGDRILLITGLIGNLVTLAILIVWLPMAVPNRNQLQDFLFFSIPVFFNVFSLPLIVLPSISLLSKVTNIHTQGLTQGIRSVFVGLAQIMGPIWAGKQSTFNYFK